MATVIISTSVTSAGTAVGLAANTLTYVLEGVNVISTGLNGMSNGSTFDNVDVRVDGLVYGELRGVQLQSDGTTDGHSLTVGATGRVLGYAGFGAQIQGAQGSVLNFGEISVSFGTGLLMQGNSGVAVNHGAITSMTANGSNSEAVQIIGSNVVVQNFGVMSALGAAGIGIDAGSQTGVRIENYGIISGVAQSILGGASADVVVNAGDLIGHVALGAGADNFNGLEGGGVIVLGELGNDALRGGQWDDSLSGGQDNDTLVGRGGDDALDGGDGDDIIRGNAGDDIIIGGLGADIMKGGLGEDTFIFNSAAEIGNGAITDLISGFRSGEDDIDLSALGALTFIGTTAFSGTAGELRYFKGSGELRGDLDGNTSVDFILRLDPNTALVAGDLIL